MISKEEVLYGQLAVVSGFIDEAQFRSAIETKRDAVERAQTESNGPPPTLPAILRDRGLIDGDQHDFLEEKLAGRAPKMLGGYEMVKKLGQGAMGAVYMARQVSMNRLVAIKILSRQLGKNKNFVARFEREARMVGKMNHVNIVSGIDSGCEKGVYYFVMEFVEGQELDEIIEKRGPLPEKEALEIILQIAHGLEHAASHGMVHRDVKPENILISKEGVAKLCDLGLAKPEDDDANLTMAGTSMGTPHYISPEQAQGLSDEIDIRSDIYSLGVSLWHAVIGDVPFRAENPTLVLTAHIDQALPDPLLCNPNLSDGICRLLKRMLAKSRGDRHANPAQLILEIQALLDGNPLRPITQRKTAARPHAGGKPVTSAKKQAGNRQSRRRRRQPTNPPTDRVQRRASRDKNNQNRIIGSVIAGAVLLLLLAIALSSNNESDSSEQQRKKRGTETGQAAGGTDDGSAARETLRAARSQMAVILLFAKSQPTAYAEAIGKFQAMLERYKHSPVATIEIKQRIAKLQSKAEQEVAKLRLSLDAEISRLLGQNKLGPAYDMLRTFPKYLEFTEGAKDLVAQRGALEKQLQTLWDRLLADASRLLSEKKTSRAVALYRKSLETFDAARRQQLREKIRLLEDRLSNHERAELKKIADDFAKLRSLFTAAIKDRRYKKALAALEPIGSQAAKYPRHVAFEPIHDLTWDLELLVLLQSAFEAAGSSSSVAAPSAERYIRIAERQKPRRNSRWPLVLAVFQFHEQQFGPAKRWMDKAQAAGVDVSRLRKRLLTRLDAWREANAEQAFKELKQIDDGMDWQSNEDRAGFRLAVQTFEKEFGQTSFARSEQEALADWKRKLKIGPTKKKRNPPDDGPVSLKELKKYLNGKVIKWDPKKLHLKLRYNFSKQAQLKDWKIEPGGGGRNNRVGKWAIKQGWLSGGGGTGIYNVIQFKERVSLSCTMVAADPRACGISLHVENAASRYLFAFNLEFGGRRNRTRLGGFIGLVNGERLPDFLDRNSRFIKGNQPYQLKAQATPKKLFFFRDNKLIMQAEHDALNRGRVGFDAWNSTARFTRVVLEGIVDRKWAEDFIRARRAEAEEDE